MRRIPSRCEVSLGLKHEDAVAQANLDVMPDKGQGLTKGRRG